MAYALSISVRFHEGRYHGAPDWPPSPARLFQALLAGSARSGGLSDTDRSALHWLEILEAAVIAVPIARAGHRLTNYVPNNDLDSVGGDPARIGELRVAKIVKPHLFDAMVPLHYVWQLDGSEQSESMARDLCRIADTLYQFGRGVDMAWAWGDVLDEADAATLLAEYPGAVYQPCARGHGAPLACPQRGSLDSLITRHAAQSHRWIPGAGGKIAFAQAPRPRFKEVAYNSPPTHFVFDLEGPPWPLERCAALVELARDKAAGRLADGSPAMKAEIERALIGRGATEADKTARVQVMALPSIGHSHADRSIRRLLVRVPPNCVIARDSIGWAFSGLALRIDAETGEILLGLVAADDESMLRHYGVGTAPAARWRSVTPVAVPWEGVRLVSSPPDGGVDPRSGSHRIAGQAQVTRAVQQALRHAGMSARADVKRIQHEPFEANGERAEAFAHGSRFAKERLWHVEVEFKDAVAGPVVVGDGRYLGLGLMRPLADAERATGVYCFGIEAGLSAAATEVECVRALRRATMARVQEALGRRVVLPKFFTGHEPDGAPSRDADHSHLAFAIDPRRARLFVVAPHRLQGRQPKPDERAALKTLDTALQGLSDLRAGASGHLRLAVAVVDAETDPLFHAARVWESVTDYHPTRHAKRMTQAEALVADVTAEIARRGLAQPENIEVLELRSGPRGGVAGRLRLRFGVAVSGPLLLGRARHMGGGLFVCVS